MINNKGFTKYCIIMTAVIGKRERILEAAIELFNRWGFTKTSLDEIARAAHIAKSTIYYYFPSKENLFIVAIEEKAEEFFCNLYTAIDASERFEDKLSCFLRLPITCIFENMPLLAMTMQQIPPDYFTDLLEKRNEYRQRMNELLAEIMDYGKSQGIINEKINSEHFSEMINDWFIMGDYWNKGDNKNKILKRLERDHNLMVQLLLYGILKRDTTQKVEEKKRIKG